jgi:protein transport protein SEC24
VFSRNARSVLNFLIHGFHFVPSLRVWISICIVSSEYFCNLDGRSMRLDHLQRPELNQGTFDFTVPKEYWAANPSETLTSPFYSVEPRPSGPRAPMPINYVFLFDVSHEAVQSGFLQVACACIRTILFGGILQDGSSVDPCFPSESSLAILTFDQTIHFYDLLVRSNTLLDDWKIYIYSVRSNSNAGSSRYRRNFFAITKWAFCESGATAVSRGFCPLHSSVDNVIHRKSIESLLNAIPERFENTLLREAALGSVLRSGLAALVRLLSLLCHASLDSLIGRTWRSNYCIPKYDAHYWFRCPARSAKGG